MDEVGEGYGEDPLRLFFRTKVRLFSAAPPFLSHLAAHTRSKQITALGSVLEEVSKQAKAFVSSSQVPSGDKSLHLQEANQLHLLASSAVTRHRAETSAAYGLSPSNSSSLSSSSSSEPWSSRPALLEAVQWHFDATDSLLRERVRDFGANVDEGRAGAGAGGKGDFARDQQAMQGELKRQMASLAEVVWDRIEERLEFLVRCVFIPLPPSVVR